VAARIDVDTLRAVRGLGENLERELGSGVTDAEDVLLRVVSFVGDAHVGLDLERIVASRPAEVDVVPVDSAVDDVVRLGMTAVVAGIPVAAAEQLCASAVTTLTPALLAAACQQNGGEGIKYISCYEGQEIHSSRRVGPLQGAYTKDCLDHDYCEATHSAGSCGDELNEAADDFLFAPQWTCDGCNNPH
jgi:hypothetical protein